MDEQSGKDKKRGPKTSGGAAATATETTETVRPPIPDLNELRALLIGEHANPHAVLGAHPLQPGTEAGLVVRAMHPAAASVDCILSDGRTLPMERLEGWIFHIALPGARFPSRHRFRFHFPDGSTSERGDPYRFAPTVGEIDLHLFNEGTHRRLWEKLGAHPATIDGTAGTSFAVWAPNARRVSVVGDFSAWDGRQFPMRRLGASGVFEIFIPDVAEGSLYKFEILTREGLPRLKTDPFAFKMEQSPGTSSIVQRLDRYEWSDDAWMSERPRRDLPREAMLIYECHIGSWARIPEEGNRSLSYREIAPRLSSHVKALGFTHVEFLPVAEHPFTGSWGYQVAGYYAPTSRYGSPDDFRHLVDELHQAGIGVIVDWVPAHFPKDDFALRRFDGTALFEHEDPRLGEHPDWGTLIFNYGRTEIRNFLTANALYWLDQYHVDGLRVDAVASMLYLDYSRKPGEWLRNRYGGRENLEAIAFIRETNEAVRTYQPGCFMIAEESTAWPGVTKPASEGGLGFTFKWNMGWMHDTLKYFARDALYRRHHQDELTFAMVYEYSEHFIMPLSHDEVVHLKNSMVGKMPGDEWQKFANLRTLITYQYTRPGKKLLFMGMEIGQTREWDHDGSIDWHLADQPLNGGYLEFMRAIGTLYREQPALWRRDIDYEGFSWIDVADRENSVMSYVRRDGDDHVIVVLNLTPVPRENYRIGVPAAGTYRELLSSDDSRFGGSGINRIPTVETQASPFHGYPQSIGLNLPPLGALLYAPVRAKPK
jgi:1,4-alpha-glucan branching enzyme